jgi:hypothetical protein
MSTGWIYKYDIVELLSKIKSINGLINKRDFLAALTKCIKEHGTPQKAKTNRGRINYKSETKASIVNYRNAIKYGRGNSFFDEYIRDMDEEQRNNLSYHFDLYNDERKLNARINIVPEKKFPSICKVSARTVARWRKENKICRFEYIINEVIKGKKTTPAHVFRFYDLSKIINSAILR